MTKICMLFFPGYCSFSQIIADKHNQEMIMLVSNTNLHDSIEEAGVAKVIDAFDRNQVVVDGWSLASGWLRII